MKKRVAVLAAASILAGCATGSAIVTGTQRSPVDLGQVQLYLPPPSNYESIALVTSSNAWGGTEQESTDYAVEELENQAAKVGANGILLTGPDHDVHSGGFFSTYFDGKSNKTPNGFTIVETNESEIIFVDEGNPPFMYKDDNGEVAGFYPALLNKIFKNMGIPLEIKAYPWKRLLDLSSRGKGGVGGIYENAERLKIYDYSKELLFLETISVVTLKTNPLLYESIGDLKGKQIGVIRGWSYGKDFDAANARKSFTVQEVASDELNLKKLEAGRIEVLVGLKLSVLNTAQKLGIDEKIVIKETPIVVNPTYVAFSKKADKTKVLSQFDAELRKFKENGGFQNLYDQYTKPLLRNKLEKSYRDGEKKRKDR